jgi:hypothetical protein
LIRGRFARIPYEGRYRKIERIKPIQCFDTLTQLILLVQRSIAFQLVDQVLQGLHHHISGSHKKHYAEEDVFQDLCIFAWFPWNARRFFW